MIADCRREPSTFDTVSFPRDARKIEERIGDIRRIQACALRNDVLRRITLVHESERLVVPRFYSDGKAGISRLTKRRKFLVCL